MDTLNKVRKAMEKQAIFSIHAHRQMDVRGITIEEVFEALEAPELVEDYPDDPRGHSCLLLGRTKSGRPLHIICAPRDAGLGGGAHEGEGQDRGRNRLPGLRGRA